MNLKRYISVTTNNDEKKLAIFEHTTCIHHLSHGHVHYLFRLGYKFFFFIVSFFVFFHNYLHTFKPRNADGSDYELS